MNRSLKLALDVLMGAVVPILVLSYLTDPLGAVPAYVVSALIPVGWVLIDLLFISRRFNVITGFLGLSAVVRGVLAFWFVSGALFALKDSAGILATAVVFAGSVLVGRPVMRAFAVQSLDPRTPAQEAALGALFADRRVARAAWWSTAALAATYAVSTVANFWLNLAIVTAPFGTGAFNGQVARVNAITRIALGIPEFVAMGISLWVLFSAVYAQLPEPPGERGFWELVQLRGEREQAGDAAELSPGPQANA